MPLCYSNFKSFRNKSSRIFWFEQLLFSKVNKLTCKGQVGLGLTGKGRWRANTGCNQLSDAIGSSHATSIKIGGCPCKLCQPYCSALIVYYCCSPPGPDVRVQNDPDANDGWGCEWIHQTVCLRQVEKTNASCDSHKQLKQCWSGQRCTPTAAGLATKTTFSFLFLGTYKVQYSLDLAHFFHRHKKVLWIQGVH